MKPFITIFLILCVNCAVSAQDSVSVEPFSSSKVKAYTQSLGIYAEENMMLQTGWGIHGNILFPFAAGVSYTAGYNNSNNMIESSVGYQLRRNRNYYRVHNVELCVSYVRNFTSLSSGRFCPGFSAGVYCKSPVGYYINRSYQQVCGLYEDCFNLLVVGLKMSLRFQLGRLCIEEIFKIGTPDLNATRMSYYTRDIVHVSTDYILAIRLSYVLTSNYTY